jgi:hypothetical protein
MFGRQVRTDLIIMEEPAGAGIALAAPAEHHCVVSGRDVERQARPEVGGQDMIKQRV